jgi:hypothetical protein
MNKQFASASIFTALLAVATLSTPGNAQVNSTAAQGTQSYSSTAYAPGLTTNATAQQSSSSLPSGYGLLAPNSVNNAPYPSGTFTYGFPNESVGPYMGVSNRTVGGYLPQTSTSSVDINIVAGDLGGALAADEAATGGFGYTMDPTGLLGGAILNTEQTLGNINGFINGVGNTVNAAANTANYAANTANYAVNTADNVGSSLGF